MSICLRLICVAGLTLSALSPAAAAQDVVFLRGYEVTPRHTVFGSVDAVHGNSAVLNLGYAHGLKTGLTLLVLRTVANELLPIGGVTVLATEADHSRARIEGPFLVQAGDFVLISAARLNLWDGTTRSDLLLRERLVRRMSGGGYNTLDASPDLIEEVARDDGFQQRQHISFERPKFVEQAAEKVGPLKRRLGAVLPLPAIDATRPQAREEAIQSSDSTILALRMFLEAARNADVLIARMTTERLQSLPLLGGGEVEESRAPLTRQVLLNWTAKAIGPS